MAYFSTFLAIVVGFLALSFIGRICQAIKEHFLQRLAQQISQMSLPEIERRYANLYDKLEDRYSLIQIWEYEMLLEELIRRRSQKHKLA